MERDKLIYLCKPNNRKYTQLNGIRRESVSITKNLKDYSSISFEVDKDIVINGKRIPSNGYNDLHLDMEIYYDEGLLFKMEEPEIHNDGNTEYKTITAYTTEKELQTKKITSLQARTGTTGSIELLASVNQGKSPLSSDFKWSTFVNDDKELSVLDIILQKAPNWGIGHIDDSIKEKGLSIDVSNTHIYGLLTSTLCYKLGCVFTFDTVNRLINAYDVKTYGKNTNVFISRRNLLNNVDTTCESDNIITRLIVTGDNDLDIRNVNYNRNYIDNIDFYKNEKYMSKTMLEKVNKREEYMNAHRQEFSELAAKLLKLEEEKNNLLYKVPSDGCDVQQWESMGKENLEKSLADYEAKVEVLRISVDKDPKYDSNGKYIPWKLTGGSVNDKKYMELLKDVENGYGMSATYYEMITYIIPNIKIAIDNLSLSDANKKDYNKSFETNWSLYGIKELEAKKEYYQAGLLNKYSKPWLQMTDAERMEYNNVQSEYEVYHKKFVEYSNYLGRSSKGGTLLHQLVKLEHKLYDVEDEIADITKQKNQLIRDTEISSDLFGMTKEEVDIYNLLIHEDTYENKNITTTSLDTIEEKIKLQERLYQDGLDKTYEKSIPQYEFTVSMDNLMNIEEFKNWSTDFDLGNFITVEIDELHTSRVRIASLEYSPYDKSSDINVTFTSMITSKGGRSDFTYLIGESENISSGGTTSTSSGSSAEVKMSDVLALIKQITSTAVFNNTVTNVVEEQIVETGKVSEVVSDYVSKAEISDDKIIVHQAWIDELFATDITATGTIKGATLIAGKIYSENYEDNNMSPLNDDGSLNQYFNVIEGMKIDLIKDKALYTPQISIYRDVISSKGLVSAGTVKTENGRGNYIGNFGRDNEISADMSLAIGDKNILGGNIEYTAIPNYEYSYTLTYEKNSEGKRVYTLGVTYLDDYYREEYLSSENYDVISITAIETVTHTETDSETGESHTYSEEYSYNIAKNKRLTFTDDLGTKTREFIFTSDLAFEEGDGITAIAYTVAVFGHPPFINSSIAAGKSNNVSSSNAFALGSNLMRTGEGVSVGRYNVDRPWNLFEVGCGKSNSTRDNAIEVSSNGDTFINNYLYMKNSKNNTHYKLAKVLDNKTLCIASDASIKNLSIGERNISTNRLLGKYIAFEASAYSGCPLVFNGNNFRADKHGIISFGYTTKRFKNMFLSGDIYANASHITTSDERLKPMRRPIEYSHEIVNGVEWIDYMLSKERSTSDRIHSGVCAQQVEEVLNELGIDRGVLIKIPKVNKPLEECSYDEIEYAIRYEEFVPYIGKVVQDHEKEIERLKQLLIKEEES